MYDVSGASSRLTVHGDDPMEGEVDADDDEDDDEGVVEEEEGAGDATQQAVTETDRVTILDTWQLENINKFS